MERRRLVNNQIRQIEEERLERIEQAPCDGPHVMVRLLARVLGVGIETADMLVHEVLSRNLRDRRAVARYVGLTGSPDERRKRREKGLARSGNVRVRRDMIQLAWRFLLHQKNSALTKWFRSRTENARGTRKPMIVALARKLLIALRRLVREGIVPNVMFSMRNICSSGHKLFVDVGESRFDDITDRLPRSAVELNQSHMSDRPKVERSSADFDPR
jgi:transposase